MRFLHNPTPRRKAVFTDINEKKAARRKYISKFKKIYEDVPEEDIQKRDELIGRLSDLCVILDECAEHLNAEGSVVEMQQGTYSIDRENPFSKVQDRTMKTYLSTIKHLDNMISDSDGCSSELLEFIGMK